MLNLLCIGEAMAELRWTAAGDVQQSFAGDTFNTTVYASRILPSGTVGFCTQVGKDPLSKSFLAMMGAEQLSPAWTAIHDTRNIGIYSVSTDKAGERSFHYWRNQSAARELFLDSADLQGLPQAKLIYISGITMAILSAPARQSLIEYLKSLKGRSLIAYDSNYRPQLWQDRQEAQGLTRQMWDLADIALPSIDDEMALFDEQSEQAVIDRFSKKSWHACAVKRGDKGPIDPNAVGDTQAFPAAPKVVDTTAAGDSFNAAYLAALLQGRSLRECMAAGHELACKVVGIHGAIAPRA